jgi:fucose permease
MTQAAIAASFASFLAFGVLQSLFGPILGLLARRYHVGIASAEFSVSMNFIGALAGIAALAYGRTRLGDRAAVLVSLATLSLGAALMASAWSWSIFLVASLCAGLGCGGIDYGLSMVFVSNFGQSNARMLNALHGMFGLGCVAGAALIGALSPKRYPVALVLVALVTFACLLCFRSLRGERRGSSATRSGLASSTVDMIGMPIKIGFLVFFILQVGVEFGIGVWEPQHLRSLGESSSQASLMAAVYWLAFASGRILVVAFGRRIAARRLAMICTLGTSASLCATAVPVVAIPAYAAAGLFLGPLFPTGLAWIADTIPNARTLSAWCIGSSWLGGIVFPFVLGVCIERFGLTILPAGLAALAFGCALVTIWLPCPRHQRLPAEELV